MDFRGRSQTERVPAQPAATTSTAPGSNSVPQSSFANNQLNKISKPPVHKLFKIGSVALLFSLTALVISLTFLLGFGNSQEIHTVNKDKFQAVFLNNGQVYFGNIKSITDQTLDLQNIYYLQTNGTTGATTQQATTASNVSLVKLGCELHAPYDQMIINDDQVTFWENLQDSSQVVKAIAEYKKQNASQACSTSSQSSTQQAPSTTTPATTATPTPAPTVTPTPAATTKKP